MFVKKKIIRLKTVDKGNRSMGIARFSEFAEFANYYFPCCMIITDIYFIYKYKYLH